MSSAFDTLFAGLGRPALQEAFGRSVVYYATAGAATGVTLPSASVGAERSSLDPEGGGSGDVRGRFRTVTISTDPDNGGVAAPAERAEVEIDGERWTVESIENQSGSMAHLFVRRLEHLGRTRPGLDYTE